MPQPSAHGLVRTYSIVPFPRLSRRLRAPAPTQGRRQEARKRFSVRLDADAQSASILHPQRTRKGPTQVGHNHSSGNDLRTVSCRTPLARNPRCLARLDLPLLLAAVQTAVFYWVMSLPAMKGTLLALHDRARGRVRDCRAVHRRSPHRELLRALGFPRELLALREDWLPPRNGQEPVSDAAILLTWIEQKPDWQHMSPPGPAFRSGQRTWPKTDRLPSSASISTVCPFRTTTARTATTV